MEAISRHPISLGGSGWTNRTSPWPTSRYQEWSHPPEPRPPQAGCWCSRFARRPNVRLIWCGNDQIMETGSDLGYRNNDRSFTNTRLNRPLTRIGAKVVSSGRYVAFQMAAVAIPKNLFADILRLIAELRPPPASRPREVFDCHGFGTNSRGTCVHMTERSPFLSAGWSRYQTRGLSFANYEGSSLPSEPMGGGV